MWVILLGPALVPLAQAGILLALSLIPLAQLRIFTIHKLFKKLPRILRDVCAVFHKKKKYDKKLC